jgi:peptidyl-prolyl cis-trans isomerase D
MLAYIRAFAKSPAAAILMGALVLSFAVFGIQDVFKNQITKDAVVQAGGRVIDSNQFKRMFNDYKSRLEQQQNGGQPISNEDAVTAGVDRQVGEGVAIGESLAAMITKSGLKASDAQVLDEIRKTPVFFDQVSGRFDRKAYQAKLAEAGMTEAQFEDYLRDQIAQAQFVSGIAAGLSPPRTMAAAMAAFTREGRSFSYFTVDTRTAGPPPKPTDAQLNAFVQKNAARFTKPELRTLSVVHVSVAATEPTMTVDPAAVQKRFDFEKDALSTAEKRTLVQIPVKDAAQGADAVARLKRGENADAVAKAYGVQTVAYTDAPRTAISDRKVAEVAFGLKEGDISPAFQGTLGQAVVKVTKVTPGHVATLDEVRPKIEAEVRKAAATDKVYDQVQKFEDARAAGGTIAEAAKKVGLTVTPLPVPVTVQGTSLQGQQLGLPPKLMQAVFQLAANGESDMQDYGQGEYFAVRVDKIAAPALATLDEVRTAATQMWLVDDVQARLRTRADALAAEVKKGKSLETAAAEVQSGVGQGVNVHRDAAQGQNPAFSNDLLGRVFVAKKGDILVAENTQLGYLVVRLDNITTGGSPEMITAVEVQRNQLRNLLFDDIGYAVRNGARDMIKPKVDYAKARQALGVDASVAPLPGAAPATPAAGAAPAPAGKAK